jgi:uncharacterized protein YjcR
MNQIYSSDYRKTILDMYASGKTVKEIVRLTSVSSSTVFKWINEAGIPRHRNVIRCLTETPMDKNKDIEFMTLIEKKKLVDGFIASKNKSQYARDHHMPNIRNILPYVWENIELSRHLIYNPRIK